MASRQNTTTALENARKALAQLEQEAGGLVAARDKALLDGASTSEAIQINKQIDATRHSVETEQRRVHLLEQRVAQEEVEAAARRHEVHLREFEQTLAKADAAGDELEGAVALLEQKFRETISLRELALSMWPFGRSSHGDAAARAPEGCALAAGAVATLLQHELHRIGAQPRLGGDPHERIKVPLPGGVPARLTPLVDQKTKQPIPLKPLGEVLRAASRFAAETLRGDKFIPPVVPQPPTPVFVFGVEQPPPPAPPPAAAALRPPAVAGDINGLKEFVPPKFREQLQILHARQAQLAMGDDDLAYQQCLADLVALRTAIEEAKQQGEDAA
jgi:hypothetical protein